MKKFIKSIIKLFIKSLFNLLDDSDINYLFKSSSIQGINWISFCKNIDRIGNLDKLNQLQLMFRYQELIAQGITLPKFEDVEFRSFSQNGEDGILLYIFSLIGMSNNKCVEICAGDGIECNTANLIINHGFHGLLFDGDKSNIERGKIFYSQLRDTFVYPPKLFQAWITRENINELIQSNGFYGEIDLLSLDMDGVDYWIWKEINCINPRVVVLEFNNLWEPNKSVTIPYKPDFKAKYNQYGCDYSGASLLAFCKLGKSKGYRLVGCQKYGFNAFFIRNGIGEDTFPEVSPSECLTHPFAKYAMEERVKNILDKEWVEV